jgi:hypothetical protein
MDHVGISVISSYIYGSEMGKVLDFLLIIYAYEVGLGNFYLSLG